MLTTDDATLPEVIPANDVYGFVARLLEYSAAAQRAGGGGLNRQLSPLAWAKDYCTIRVCGARQSGHTAAALKLVAERFADDCIFMGTAETLRTAKEHFPAQLARAAYRTSPMTLDMIRGVDVGAVIVDGTSHCSHGTREKLYRLTLPALEERETFFYVLLG